MKLDEKQKKIISSIQLQAKAPISQIAEETGLRPHVVRYIIDNLKKEKIIREYASIDPTYLGLEYQGVFFSYLCKNEAEREKLRVFLKNSTKVSLAREYAGEFLYGAMLLVSNLREVHRFISEMSKTSSGQLTNKSIATWNRWARFRHKFLSAHPSDTNKMEYGGLDRKEAKIHLDETNRLILHHLANSALPSNAYLARVLRLPKSTVDDRIKNMEQIGLINGYFYDFRSAACGLHSYRLLLNTKSEKENLCDSIFRFAELHPNVKSIAHCTGSWDYDIGLRTDQPKEIPSIVQSIYSRYCNDISSLKLLGVIGSRIKYSHFPF